MKRVTICLCCVLLMLLMHSCNKKNGNNAYDALNGNLVVTGYVYIVDPLSAGPPAPLSAVSVYLNTTADTTTYIFQTTTDSAGKFVFATLKNDYKYTIFTNFTMNNTEYTGVIKLNTGSQQSILLYAYPKYTNVMSLTFADSAGGPIQNVPFSLFTSRVFALIDTARYAYVNSMSDTTGQFIRYNLPPAKYYIVSKVMIDSAYTLSAFDSITVQDTGRATRMVTVH